MAEVTPVREPGFITYLLNPDLEHDCYFVVQTPNSGMSERIGVVKKMLLAHSLVLRAELEESMLAMKGDIHVEDLFADTIRNLLKYVYGHDNVASLCFDAADNLLYAAEKYMIKPLKNKLAEHLMSLLNAENICSLMNNPVCFTHLELQSTITMILQFETLKVLESPQFLDLRFDAFLTILEQDSLVVQEIEIWRAALKWAKHNGDTSSVSKMRTLTDLYWLLCEAVVQANTFYSSQLLAAIFSSFVHIIITLYYFFISVWPVIEVEELPYLAMQLYWAASHICHLVLLVWPSTSVTYAAEETAPLICKFINKQLDPHMKKQLEPFLLQLLHHNARFSAHGFFQIHNYILTSIASSVTTYLVILIQFQTMPSQQAQPCTRPA